MFGVLKTGFKIAKAQANLRSEFRLELNDVPDPGSIRESFETLTAKGSVSSEASTALLYFLVVRNFLLEVEQRRLAGKDVDPVSLVPLTDIYDKGIGWWEKAPDSGIFEIALQSVNVEIAIKRVRFG